MMITTMINIHLRLCHNVVHYICKSAYLHHLSIIIIIIIIYLSLDIKSMQADFINTLVLWMEFEAQSGR